MEDVELVIKIPEEEYKQIMNFGFLERTHGKMCYKAIKNGTPLPDNATNGNKQQARSCDNCTHDKEEYFNKYCINCFMFSQYESNQIEKNCFTCGKEPCLGRQDDPQIPCNEWIAK